MPLNPQSCRVLVLGASGLLGRMLHAVWQAEPPEAFEFTWVTRAGFDGFETRVWDGHGADLPPADVVLALWGVKPGKGAALAGNTDLAMQAIKLAQRVGAGRVLHASSAAVYAPGALLSEDSPLEPVNDYGRAKLEMERAIDAWLDANPDGPAQVMMRIGNVAGADSLFLNLAPGRALRLDQFADGTAPRRSYIAPHDLARVIAALCLSDATGPINTCAPEATGMDEIARAAGGRIEWVPAPETALPIVQLDTSRLWAICPLPPIASEAKHLVGSAKATGVWP